MRPPPMWLPRPLRRLYRRARRRWIESRDLLLADVPQDTVGENGSPYLTRYYLFGKNRGGAQVRLHHFHRGDEDAALHNHPWYGLSLILSGGYREERRQWTPTGSVIAVRDYRPGQFNAVAPHTFHRVDLLGRGCWTLFLTGPVVQTWVFWDRATNTYTAWRDFLAAKAARRAAAR